MPPKFLIKLLGGETLDKITRTIDIWRYFGGKTKVLKMYDYDQLQKAFREKCGIKPVVNQSASFLFANWFNVVSDDENAQEALNDFWDENRDLLFQAGLEGGLFGNTYLAFEFQQDQAELAGKVLHPGAVAPVFDTSKPWIITGYVIKTTIEQKTIEETISDTEWKIKVDGRQQENLAGSNPYKILPIVHVAEIKFSDEQFGTGEVDQALFNLTEQYKRVLDRGVEVEEYHGSPIPIFTGIKDFSEVKQEIEEKEGWKPGLAFGLPKDADCKFLESTRSVENTIELLKKIFYNFVIQSETPEFMLGVHIPSSQASTREQRAPIERKTERRRLVWTKALQRANQILLRIMEYHRGGRFGTYRTKIEWGPIFEKDKTAEADAIQKKAQAISTLRELGTISAETARRALPEIIDDPKKEEQRVADEEKARDRKLPAREEPEPEPGE